MRIVRRVLFALLGGAAGAGAGMLVGPLAIAIGGGWSRHALAGGALFLAAALPVGWVALLIDRPAAALIRLAAGPIAGAALGTLAFALGPPSVADAVVRSVGRPIAWYEASIAGGLLGTLLATALDLADRNEPLAGAALGLLPGLVLGARGAWSNDRWLAAGLGGALVAFLCHGPSALAWDLRRDERDRLASFLAGGLAAAGIGALATWGLPALAGWLGPDPDSWWGGPVLFVFHLPPGLCRLLAVPENALGGAIVGATVAVAIGLVDAGGWSVIVGAAFGLADRLAGGAILGALFGTAGAGAATAAIVGSVHFALRGDADRGRTLCVLVALALVVGAAIAGARHLLGDATIPAAVAGGLLGPVAATLLTPGPR